MPLRDARSPMRAVASLGAAVFAASTALAAAEDVHRHEARVFRRLNRLPGPLGAPLGVVMQAGNYLATPVTAAVLWRRDRPRAAVAAGVAGTAAWLGAKAVKRSIGRGRPEAELTEVLVRGRPQTGLGYPSGHAAVSVALGLVVGPTVAPALRPLVAAVPAATVAARVHVGAHLPLDVVGGAALGAVCGAVASLATGSVTER